MKFNGTVNVISVVFVNEDTVQIVVNKPSEMSTIIPGQFFNMISNDSGYPMLRRPISVSGFTNDTIEFTIKIIGNGTKALSKLKKEDCIHMMGPLGNGFEFNNEKNVLIIGGGIGVAPVKCLLETLVDKDVNIDSVLGFKDSPFLEDKFVSYSRTTKIYSEKNTQYHLGYATEGVIELLDTNSYDMVYGCGPHVMLKSLSKICLEKGVKIQLLMEEKMACGIGACLVCTCKVKSDEFNHKHVRVCADGPMFYGSEVIFHE